MTVYLVIRRNHKYYDEERHIFKTYEKARAFVETRAKDLVRQGFEMKIDWPEFVQVDWPDDGYNEYGENNLYEEYSIKEMEVE